MHCSVASAVKMFGGSRLSVKLFHRPFGVIINPVGLAGQKALAAFVFVLDDILNWVKTSFTEITENKFHRILHDLQ